MKIFMFLVGCGIFYYFMNSYGILLGFIFGFAFMFTVDMISGFIGGFIGTKKQQEEETIVEKLRAENAIVTIEAVECQGQIVYLAYNWPNNKFLLQDLKITELAEGLKQKFEGKNIFVKEGAELIKPLDTAVHQFQL